MNSVAKHLGVETKAATLVAMRSAKKEIFLVVEGDSDVDLYAQTLNVPRSNLLSCDGKGILMGLFEQKPRSAVDEGVIFFRDRDHDEFQTGEIDNVLLLVTSLYDSEMELLTRRLFRRIFQEFSACSADDVATDAAFKSVRDAANSLGALRYISQHDKIHLDFDDLKYSRFLDFKTLSVDHNEMVRYIAAKSEIHIPNQKQLVEKTAEIISRRGPGQLACGKDFIEIMEIAISRTYQFCKSSECSTSVLSRMIRVAANDQDIRSMHYFPALKNKVLANTFKWPGISL